MLIPKKFRLLWNQFLKSYTFYGFNSKKSIVFWEFLVRVNILPRVALGKQSSSARIMYWSFYLFFISEREPYLISVSCIPSSCYLIGMRCR